MYAHIIAIDLVSFQRRSVGLALCPVVDAGQGGREGLARAAREHAQELVRGGEAVAGAEKVAGLRGAEAVGRDERGEALESKEIN